MVAYIAFDLFVMEDARILLVEDEQKIANTLQLGLTEQGFDAEVAYHGSLAQNLIRNQSYDLIILDINLPGVNGYELCKFIRASDSQVPVIMLTALSTLNNKVEGYDAGADDYIVKPFEFKELLMKVRVLLRRTMQPPAQEHILRADDLSMNLDSKEVVRSNTPINLTAKEFQLLEYLLQNKNKVVSRADIAINVWDIDFDTNTNVIDVYINYLRNKIDKPFDTKLIQTQVGMGYVLKESGN